MGKYIGRRLVARPELHNTFGTDSTVNDHAHGVMLCIVVHVTRLEYLQAQNIFFVVAFNFIS